jgi:uncharacterized membrane protein
MKWNRWYRARSYTRSSLWIVPFIAIPFEMVFLRGAYWLDTRLSWTLLGFTQQGAQSLLQTIDTLALSFLVFTFGSLLVAIQIASGQLTPRIIATTLLRDDVVRYTVGLFIFTLLYALRAQDQLDASVPQTVVFLAATLGVACLAAFLYLIDYAARLLRPISILQKVSRAGLSVIDSVFPEPSQHPDLVSSRHRSLPPPSRIILHNGTSEIILAVNLKMLVSEAKRANAIIEMISQVGDFVAGAEPLFNLRNEADRIDDDLIRSAVAFGPERTMEQDPTFAFRIIVDIALRALSPAINDPTTAVLRRVGRRFLRNEEISDEAEELRVIFRTPEWEDFVNLTFTEIRQCGAGQTQVARRLRSMIDNLIQTLPDYRHPALRLQLSLLDRALEAHYSSPEDLALARNADSQGLGGHSETSRP